MTKTDRGIALALLKRLRERGLITQAEYAAACGSRVFDEKEPARRACRGESRSEARRERQT